MFFFGSSFNHNVQAILNVSEGFDVNGNGSVDESDTNELPNLTCYVVDQEVDVTVTMPKLKRFAFVGENIVRKVGSVQTMGDASSEDFSPAMVRKIVDQDAEDDQNKVVLEWQEMPATINDDFFKAQEKHKGHNLKMYVVILSEKDDLDDLNDSGLQPILSANSTKLSV